MKENEVKRVFTIDEETDHYFRAYMEEHQIRYNGVALAKMCRDHEQAKQQEWSLRYITEVVTKHLHEVMKEELTKIRLGTNSADKNTQMLIEFMNGIYEHEQYQGVCTTDIAETEATKHIREVVEERIAHKRQKKMDYQASKGQTKEVYVPVEEVN
ncbi:hypothetical protein CN568_26580 [Bacillus pseudomycoides]|uniref:hypothetical protein n=2 Tax=Bacillus pseudomycoides TaxID=64104 RepID=UPI000BEF9498|nr:hypothetical protein [Bacillus pseudomycoides]PEK37222.1 hypothetical protein CN691_07680 [Bacillus pseudomycoides]PEK62679.1 hypothetical protein CN593_25090 [Bacillus pseudomycoides]PEP37934.1 hypothetical protein CN568_26580 [Bacillus pseudomycoides]PEP41031.1 hypothetical protein CN565_14285 [Bacillus pseudomycoides]PEP75789.1 hypothetical protein CN584_26640 [Bacillus pseudomycoides]